MCFLAGIPSSLMISSHYSSGSNIWSNTVLQRVAPLTLDSTPSICASSKLLKETRDLSTIYPTSGPVLHFYKARLVFIQSLLRALSNRYIFVALSTGAIESELMT